jgi:type II secretory pathway component PulM
MQTNWSQTIKSRWLKWRQEKPAWVICAGAALACVIYYLLIISSLNFIVNNLQDEIDSDQSKAVWMAKASKEILRLRQAVPHQKIKSNASAFTMINKAIQTAGWNNLVTDVHQVEQNRVQVTFNSIPYADLIDWLVKLYDKNGIYVLDITLEKKQAGIVEASIVLQENPA